MIIYITSYKNKIYLKDNKIVILKANTEKISYPINIINQIVIIGNGTISINLIKRLLQRNVIINFVNRIGRFNGQILTPHHINLPVKELQYKFTLFKNQQYKLKLAKDLIINKIINSHRLLLRWYNKDDSLNRTTIKQESKKILNLINKATNIKTVRAYEGIYARYYYNVYSWCLKKKFGFKGRNKYPPKDPINSMLSFGYTLLANDITSIIYQEGLDPYFGFYHTRKYNNPGLALDLMEPFRSVIIDSIVLQLINQHSITKDDFKKGPKGAILMSKKLIKIFISKYQERRETSYKINNNTYKYFEIYGLMAKSFKNFLINKESNKLFKFMIR